jgi:hypothetical protein
MELVDERAHTLCTRRLALCVEVVRDETCARIGASRAIGCRWRHGRHALREGVGQLGLVAALFEEGEKEDPAIHGCESIEVGAQGGGSELGDTRDTWLRVDGLAALLPKDGHRATQHDERCDGAALAGAQVEDLHTLHRGG